jgi:hypothetical protein
MTHAFSAIGMALLVGLSGWSIARGALRSPADRWMRVTLALPLGALVNVLVFFLCTLTSVPLGFFPFAAGHLLTALGAWLLHRRWHKEPRPAAASREPWPAVRRVVLAACCLLLAVVALYAIVHALVLPPFHYDSLTNWIVRAKMSFLEGRLVFDALGPHALLRKPGYPFLLHALQIAGNLGVGSWNDSAANLLPLLTSFSLLASAGLIVARLRGMFRGVLAVSLVVSVPLFAAHLGEGYADHLLAEFALLALCALAAGIEEGRRGWLVMSALVVAAACWTKSEGIVFVALPWLAALAAFRARVELSTRDVLFVAGIALGLALPWHIFALFTGLSLTPHGGSDLGLWPRWEGVLPALSAMFLTGSFGIGWYAVAAMFAFTSADSARGRSQLQCRLMPAVLLGMVSLALVLVVYLLTPNVEYLLNGESFDRQLLTPLLLFIGVYVLGVRAETATSNTPDHR